MSAHVEGLRVELVRGGADIVDEIALEIAPGEVLGLVGESGSGKTTVGLALLGHVRRGGKLAAGSVKINDRDLTTLSSRELRTVRGREVAYIPQDPGTALNPALRIGTQLREVLKGSDPLGTREVLEEVALPSDDAFLRRYPHQLSGGQQQRVAIAMAFAPRPSVVVCDEPTTGLDVVTQARVLETIRELCRNHGVAALYVTHDLAVVATLADRIAVMYAGRIVESGPRELIFARARHPYTRRLLRAVPDLGGRRALVGIPGHAPLPGARPPGCAFHPRCALASDHCAAAAPLETVISRGWSVRCFNADRTDEPITAPAPVEAPPAGAPLLAVSALHASYGSTQVLTGIELAVADGECLAVVGESGSGKTTLARSLGGLHAGWTGTMTYAGAPLAPTARARPADTRRDIQYVFQNPYSSLNPRRTVGQTLSRQLERFEPKADTDKRVREALDQVALSARAVNRFPDQLSGGERQRVAIARGLIVRPRVLLCDEVTSALDVSVQAAVVDLLARLRAELGLTLVFITHDLALVRSIADRVVVLTAGTIAELGPAEQVFTAPSSDYTRTLLAATPTY